MRKPFVFSNNISVLFIINFFQRVVHMYRSISESYSIDVIQKFQRIKYKILNEHKTVNSLFYVFLATYQILRKDYVAFNVFQYKLRQVLNNFVLDIPPTCSCKLTKSIYKYINSLVVTYCNKRK